MYFKRTEFREYHKLYLQTPVLLHISFLTIFTAIAIILVYNNHKWYTTHVSVNTLKDGFDNLPTGICVHNKDGFTSLINKKMDTLCQMIVGKPLQNGLIFWDNITTGKIKPTCKTLQYGSTPVIQLENGKIYMFTRKEINDNSFSYYEINSTDITEEYSKTIQLSENNNELLKINERLRNYGEHVTEAIRDQEILNAKIKIHDTFNMLMLYTKHCIDDGCTPQEKAKLVELWQGNILMLCKNDVFSENKSPINELTDAADSIGIKLNISGTIPQNKQVFHAFLLTAIECITNSAKHAQATELNIDCTEDEICFYDDSDLICAEYVEGGGLSSVRKCVEGSGGVMKIETTPRFIVKIIFNHKGE